MSQQALPISFAQGSGAKPQKASAFLGHARLISALTLVSRILGMARESVVATYFGAGAVSSAFAVAFKIPNLFRKLLGEGALSAAFIPLYAQAIKSGDKEEANRFASASVNFLALVLIGLTILGEAALWGTTRLVHLREQDLLIVRLTMIMLPYVLLICGTAFLGGILQVHRRFALPAFAPVLLNVIHIAVIVIGARLLMLTQSEDAENVIRQTRLAYWLAGFVLVAGVMQITMLMPSLRAVGFRFVGIGKFWTPGVARMLKLSVPVAMGAGVLQLSVVLDTGITVLLTGGDNPQQKLHLLGHAMAYPLALGAVARLNWAQFLYQFPLGVFAIALATAIFPGLSADALDQDRERFRRVLRQGILISLLEGLPASVGLILVRYPAIRLLFQHGSFTATDTEWVARSVLFYSAAIWAFSLQQILNRAYYALHDTMTPFVLSIVTLAVNTVVEVPLCFTRLGEAGIAAGTLVSFAIQAVVMLWMLDRKAGGLQLGMILRTSGKMIVATAIMGVACVAARYVPMFPGGSSHLASLEQLAIVMFVGGVVYGGCCLLMGLKKTLRSA